jgi:flagellum-specific peptidoglycan hydrolase FlgJ
VAQATVSTGSSSTNKLTNNNHKTTDTISSLAGQAAKSLGWNPDFIMAQWSLETGNFSSKVWKIDNNAAGIKWYPGMKYGTKGTAASDGGYYAHFSDPVTGYVNFVDNNPRYSNVSNYSTVAGEAQAVKNDGWATDPNYVSKILGMKVNGSQTVQLNGLVSRGLGMSGARHKEEARINSDRGTKRDKPPLSSFFELI